MVSEINIEDISKLAYPVIDVRSPGEFKKGHIPGAINIPLFTNDERAHVGTVYKQQSKDAAIALGYKFVTPRLEDFITFSLKIAPDKNVIIHCWRGGMRSRSFAKHLSDNGFNDVRIIIGGYKSFRNHVLNQLGRKTPIKVLGGYTGSGKTYILKELQKLGEQIIDLEGLAHHKGSAFGAIGEKEQPSVEQFENNLYEQWQKLDLGKPVWVEDESHNIGSVKIPMPFYKQIRSSRLFFIDIPKNERAKHLVSEYANCDDVELANSLERISKRIGGLNWNNSLELLKQKKYVDVAMTALHYYDKAYLKGMNKRDGAMVVRIPQNSVNHANNAFLLKKITKQYE